MTKCPEGTCRRGMFMPCAEGRCVRDDSEYHVQFENSPVASPFIPMQPAGVTGIIRAKTADMKRRPPNVVISDRPELSDIEHPMQHAQPDAPAESAYKIDHSTPQDFSSVPDHWKKPAESATPLLPAYNEEYVPRSMLTAANHLIAGYRREHEQAHNDLAAAKAEIAELREYCGILVNFFECCDWGDGDPLPDNVWKLIQHWPNIDKVKGE